MMVVGLATAWVAGIVGFITAAPFISYVSPLPSGATYLGFFNGIFLIGIPIVGLVLWLGRTIFRTKSPAWLGSGMAILWVINFISLVILGGWAVAGFRQSGSVSKSLDLSRINTDTLRIESLNRNIEGSSEYWFSDGEGFHISDDQLKVNEMIRVYVRRSNSRNFEFTQTIRARGATSSEAAENAGQTEFDVEFDGKNLRIPTGYSIPSGNKWRVQEVRLTIGVPEGKFIVFGQEINRRIWDVDYSDSDHESSIYNNPNRVFRMTASGLTCADCPQFGDRNYQSHRDYENFTLEGNFETEIIEGDDFSIEFNDTQNEREALDIIRSGDNLSITARGQALSGRLRCIIRTPTFTSLVADNTGPVTIRGFDEGRASIIAKGPVKVRGFFDCHELDLALSGKSIVELIGNGIKLDATLREGAQLDASGYRCENAEISASESSTAHVNAQHYVQIRTDPSSNVKVDGTAEVKRQ